MTRQEFCDMLAAIRQQSNKKMTEICAAMGILPTAIYRLERNYNNFEIDKALAYINVFQMQLLLAKEGKTICLNNSSDFASWLKETRSNQYTQRSLAAQAGCTYQTIANIERGATVVRIDTLLKLVEVFGYTIKIEPK